MKKKPNLTNDKAPVGGCAIPIPNNRCSINEDNIIGSHEYNVRITNNLRKLGYIPEKSGMFVAAEQKLSVTGLSFDGMGGDEPIKPIIKYTIRLCTGDAFNISSKEWDQITDDAYVREHQIKKIIE